MKSFRSLQQRATRQAGLGSSEQSVAHGDNAVCDVRIAGADIGGNTSGREGKI